MLNSYAKTKLGHFHDYFETAKIVVQLITKTKLD